MRYIANSFSLQMITSAPSTIRVEEVENFPSDCVSAVGHPDTASVLGVACNRVNITINEGDELFVAQLQGGRLPEGATSLPEGFALKIFRITLM